MSDWPGGATFTTFGVRDLACLPVVFFWATRLAVRLFEFAGVLFATDVCAPGAFAAAAAFLAGPGWGTVADVVALDAVDLRAGDFLGGELFATGFATVAFREVVFRVLARRVEPLDLLGAPDAEAGATSAGAAGTALACRALRPGVACFAGRFALLLGPLPLGANASATTASASSNVS